MTTIPAYVPPEKRSGDLVSRSRADLDTWLASRTEPALEPDLPIIDPHHHLWVRPGDSFGIPDLRAEIDRSGHNVRATVFIECRWQYDELSTDPMAPVAESRHVAAISREKDVRGICLGIVGFADLTLESKIVGQVLDAHIEACAPGQFKGVRHRAVWDPFVRPNTPGLRPGLLIDPKFQRGLQVLADKGLSYEAWQYYTQLQELVQAARAVPKARIIVNHTAGMIGIGDHAKIKGEVTERWRRGVADLAACDNVVMKLGGLGMLHCGFDFQYGAQPPSSEELVAAWRPYIEYCIEKFGPNRCMFESNVPPDRQSCSYGVLWNAFKRITAACSAAEKQALYFGTAQKAYRLNVN